MVITYIPYSRGLFMVVTTLQMFLMYHELAISLPYKFLRHVNFKEVTNPAFVILFVKITKYPTLWLMKVKVLPMQFRRWKFCGWPVYRENLKNYIPWKFVCTYTIFVTLNLKNGIKFEIKLYLQSLRVGA